jgi:uridine kinase
MRVIDTRYISDNAKDPLKFVLRSEEFFHDQISAAAASIVKTMDKKPLVCLAGPSGSGKTTTAIRLKVYLENLGLKVNLISMDNFFFPLDQRPKAATDWESPLCVNWELLVDRIRRLLNGEIVTLPKYDFSSGKSCDGPCVAGEKDGIIIVEGIHMLNPLVIDRIADLAIGVYTAPRTRIITPDDRIIHPAQIRVSRRILRDYQYRGHAIRDTIAMADSVDRGEKAYIAPYKHYAPIQIDTSLDYELSLFAEHLRAIPDFCELDMGFLKEHRMDTLYDVVMDMRALHCSYIPKDSVSREFIGGSVFEY